MNKLLFVITSLAPVIRLGEAAPFARDDRDKPVDDKLRLGGRIAE
jgi:hypothetical protein